MELTLVPDAVASVEEASGAMRKAVHCCVLLANQADLLPNTFQLRASLLTHLFCGVLPAPLPLTHPRRRSECFWASQTVRYETQAELLRCLRLLLLHFGAAGLSMTATRSFDAARLLTLASFATIADAVLRLRVTDHPSPFCLHYSGDADGPVRPFGFEMGPFGVEAEYLRFHCPERTGRLTQVLDYFHGVEESVADDHVIFRWEKSPDFGPGDAKLLSQVCLQMGFPMDPDELPFYLSGESRELGDNYPEMPVMRDIVFFFKALMTPTSESLPELRGGARATPLCGGNTNPAWASRRTGSRGAWRFTRGKRAIPGIREPDGGPRWAAVFSRLSLAAATNARAARRPGATPATSPAKRSTPRRTCSTCKSSRRSTGSYVPASPSCYSRISPLLTSEFRWY